MHDSSTSHDHGASGDASSALGAPDTATAAGTPAEPRAGTSSQTLPTCPGVSPAVDPDGPASGVTPSNPGSSMHVNPEALAGVGAGASMPSPNATSPVSSSTPETVSDAPEVPPPAAPRPALANNSQPLPLGQIRGTTSARSATATTPQPPPVDAPEAMDSSRPLPLGQIRGTLPPPSAPADAAEPSASSTRPLSLGQIRTMHGRSPDGSAAPSLSAAPGPGSPQHGAAWASPEPQHAAPSIPLTLGQIRDDRRASGDGTPNTSAYIGTGRRSPGVPASPTESGSVGLPPRPLYAGDAAPSTVTDREPSAPVTQPLYCVAPNGGYGAVPPPPHGEGLLADAASSPPPASSRPLRLGQIKAETDAPVVAASSGTAPPTAPPGVPASSLSFTQGQVPTSAASIQPPPADSQPLRLGQVKGHAAQHHGTYDPTPVPAQPDQGSPAPQDTRPLTLGHIVSSAARSVPSSNDGIGEPDTQPEPPAAGPPSGPPPQPPPDSSRPLKLGHIVGALSPADNADVSAAAVGPPSGHAQSPRPGQSAVHEGAPVATRDPPSSTAHHAATTAPPPDSSMPLRLGQVRTAARQPTPSDPQEPAPIANSSRAAGAAGEGPPRGPAHPPPLGENVTRRGDAAAPPRGYTGVIDIHSVEAVPVAAAADGPHLGRVADEHQAPGGWTPGACFGDPHCCHGVATVAVQTRSRCPGWRRHPGNACVSCMADTRAPASVKGLSDIPHTVHGARLSDLEGHSQHRFLIVLLFHEQLNPADVRLGCTGTPTAAAPPAGHTTGSGGHPDDPPPAPSQPLTLGLILSETRGEAGAGAAEAAQREQSGSPAAPPPDLAAAAAQQAGPYVPTSQPLRLGAIMATTPRINTDVNAAPPPADPAAAAAGPGPSRPLTLGRILSETGMQHRDVPEGTADLRQNPAGDMSPRYGLGSSAEYNRQLAYARRKAAAVAAAPAAAAPAAAALAAPSPESTQPLSLREIKSREAAAAGVPVS